MVVSSSGGHGVYTGLAEKVFEGDSEINVETTCEIT
jgi:hypothetical protein